MDTSFLIPANAPAKGTKVTDPAAPETAKGDTAQGEASFGEVLEQVESGATVAAASETGQQPAGTPTGETAAEQSAEASAEGFVVSLSLALTQQVLALVPVQTDPEHTDVSALPGDVPAEGVGELTAIAGSSVQAAPATGLSASTALPAGMTPTAMTPQEAMHPDKPSVEAHLTLTAQATQIATPRGQEMTAPIADRQPVLSQPSDAQAETGRAEEERETTGLPLAAAPTQTVSQDSARVAAAAVADRLQDAPAAPAPTAEVEHQAKAAPQPVAKPLPRTAAEDPGAQAGQPQGESGGQSQEAVVQDRTMLEQAQRLSTDVQEGKPAGQDRKAPNAAGLPASERLPVGSGEVRAFRQDESVKIAAAAPVVPTAEPAGPAPVQALRLEVERPDLGQVALRVVLADQTIHAKVTTDHLEVRDFLIARQGQLESGLKANGLEMGEFRVDVNQHRQPESGWLGSDRDAWGQGRQQSGHPQAPPPDVAADRWSGDLEAAAASRPSRSLSVFA